MQPTERTHTALNGMTRETSREEKPGMAIPSAGTKYRHHWPHNGSLKRKFKGEPYVERRGGGSNDSQVGEVYRTN